MTRDQLEALALDVARHAHDRNRWQVTLWDDGSVSIIERISDTERSCGDVLMTVGTGSAPCNCDACVDGAIGDERLGDDDVSVYADLISEAIKAVEQENDRAVSMMRAGGVTE